MGSMISVFVRIPIVPSAAAGSHMFGKKRKSIPNFQDRNPNLKSKSSNINRLVET
jgi:hypothetical protein